LLVAGSDCSNAEQETPPCAAVHSYLESAQESLAAGDSAYALKSLNRAVQMDSKCADVYLLLGLVEFQRGETARSIQHYKQALKLAPSSYSAHYDLALAYLKEKNLPDARNELEQAVTVDPKQADAAYDLGIVLLEMGQPAAALPHLYRAHALDENRGDVSFNVVRAELEAGHPAEARKAAQNEAGHFASDFQWNVGVGQLFLKHGQPADAALYLRAANRIHPESDDVRNQLATVYLASRQSDDVLDLIRQPKTADEHYFRGSAFYLSHRFSDADAESEAALNLAPDNPRILVLRVRLLQRAGQQNAALEMAQRATILAPDWDEPYYLTGISYYFLRHYAQARESLSRAFELNGTSAATIFVEALAWAGEGNYQEAEMCLRRAISLQPANARFQCHLGILLLRRNDAANAEKSFIKAIELKPEYALSHYELGKVRAQSKQWKEASEELEKAIALDPGLTSAYYQLGIVYGRLGEKEKAQDMFARLRKLQQQEMDELATVDEDARQETDSR
jgi:tetratricopeptide (TPR) repeat protein